MLMVVVRVKLGMLMVDVRVKLGMLMVGVSQTWYVDGCLVKLGMLMVVSESNLVC